MQNILIPSASSAASGSVSVGSLSLANGKIIVGNSSNIGAAVTPSGQVSMTNAGVFTVTRQFTVGTAITSNSSSINATSFTAFDQTPSVSFTATRTATFKISVPIILYLCTGTAGHALGLKVVNTVGGATITFNGEWYGEISTLTSRALWATAFCIAACTASTAYTFQLQGKVGNGADSMTLISSGAANGVVMLAEEV